MGAGQGVRLVGVRIAHAARTIGPMTSSPYYITTPIYYVNDRPHIGHCYTTLLADVAARFERLARCGLGRCGEVFFLTGTDEHADKVVTSAAAHGATPQQWADRNAAEFEKAFAFLGSTHDDFIRTTQPRHKEKVSAYLRRLLDTGDVYKGDYTGWYDEGQEEYVTETAARENEYKSRISGKPLVKRTEACYFFRLSKYQPRLLELIQGDENLVRPDSRRQEILGRLKPPAVLNDVPISRPVTDDPATRWGIRIPGDDAHRVYVWIDALFNYLSVVDTPERRRFWPASVHLIGKDILWFHAVIWPAVLLALGEKLPRTIFGHGWWISEGQKMSKSLGNFIDLERLKAYADRYGLDALRYFLATQGPMSGADADFSHAKFVEVYNADLANGLGNCASRVGNMIEKYFAGRVPAPPESAKFIQPPAAGLPGAVQVGHSEVAGSLEAVYDWPHECTRFARQARANLERLDLGSALLEGIALVGRVDAFINVTQPFKLAKRLDEETGARERLGGILYCCAEAVRVASLLLWPAMPAKVEQLWRTWNCTPPEGVPLAKLAEFGGQHALKPGGAIAKGEALFMRADVKDGAPGSAGPRHDADTAGA